MIDCLRKTLFSSPHDTIGKRIFLFVFWQLGIPAFVLLAITLFFYLSAVYEAYPFCGITTSFEELHSKYPKHFRDLPEAFNSFPHDGIIEWNYSLIILNCRRIYGRGNLSDIEKWCTRNIDVFHEWDRFDGDLEVYYNKLCDKDFKTSKEFSLPCSEERYVDIGKIPTKGRLVIRLYVSQERFVIAFR